MIHLELNRKHLEGIGILTSRSDRTAAIKAYTRYIASFVIVGPLLLWFSSAFIYDRRHEHYTISIAIAQFFASIASCVELIFF